MKALRWKRVIWPLVGVALFALLVWLAGPQAVGEQLSRLDIGIVLICMLLLLAAGVIGALNVYLLMGNAVQSPFGSFLPFYWLSWSAGLVLPGQVGDIAMLAWALKRKGIQLSSTLGNSLLDKLISLSVMAGFATMGLIYSLPDLTNAVLFCLGVVILLMATALALLRSSSNRRWLKLFNHRLLGGMILALSQAKVTLLQRTGRVALNLALTTVKVILTGGAYWMAFSALGEKEHTFWAVTSLAMTAGLVAYLPISLNGIGTVEASGVAVFGTLGIPPATVLAAYLVLRLLVFTVAWIPTAIWLLIIACSPEKKEATS